MPLAWYFSPQWSRVYGSEWAARVCNRWIENDRNLKHFAGEVCMGGKLTLKGNMWLMTVTWPVTYGM